MNLMTETTNLHCNLKSCPFCGTNENLFVDHFEPFYRVECGECGAAGPISDSSEAAQELYQERVKEEHTQYTQTIQ